MKLTGIGLKRAGEMIREAEQQERDEALRERQRLQEERDKAFAKQVAEKKLEQQRRKAWIATLSPYEQFEEERLDVLARQYEEAVIKPV